VLAAPSAPAVFPQPGVAVDLDFIGRRYYWNGAERAEANFTTLTLNGATWEARGLNVSTCTVNPDITITLAALGLTMPPCVYGFAGYLLSVPAANKGVIHFDDGGAGAERFFLLVSPGPALSLQVTDNNVSQASLGLGVGIVNRFGLAFSAQLNEVLAAGNGTPATADVTATMPTVTQLKLGVNATVAGSFPPAVLSRLWIFTAVKTQAELNAISTQIRDAPVTPSWVWPGAAVDLDFVRRRYYWNGLTRSEANFTTFVLNGAAFGAQGLDFSTCTINPSITITLAALGLTMPPCVYGFGGYFLSGPAAAKSIIEINDGTSAERFALLQQPTVINPTTIDGGVQVSNQSPGTIGVSASRFGVAFSAQLDDVKTSGNGIAAAADTSATMPTVTTLKIGAGALVGSWPMAVLSRLVIFTAVKTQAELNQLSIDMRDAA
jgi:hypothetical protein